MFAAKIECEWIKVFEGKTPLEIIKKAYKYQDFDCLLEQGREFEDEEGQKELDKLEVFINKYHSKQLTMEDIKNLDIKLGIGDIRCVGIAEGDEEINKLKW